MVTGVSGLGCLGQAEANIPGRAWNAVSLDVDQYGLHEVMTWRTQVKDMKYIRLILTEVWFHMQQRCLKGLRKHVAPYLRPL